MASLMDVTVVGVEGDAYVQSGDGRILQGALLVPGCSSEVTADPPPPRTSSGDYALPIRVPRWRPVEEKKVAASAPDMDALEGVQAGEIVRLRPKGTARLRAGRRPLQADPQHGSFSASTLLACSCAMRSAMPVARALDVPIGMALPTSTT